MSVLIPVLDEEQHLPDVLDAMRAQRFDGTIELIFVNGPSRDGTEAILRDAAARDSRIQVLTNPEANTPASLNLALARARGRYIARMDAHTAYPPNYLALGVNRLAAGGAAHVSGPQIARGRDRWSARVALALSTRLGTGGATFRHASDEEFDVESGFTGLWERSTLERHGGWDEAWINDQDSELAARIAAEGGRIVCLPGMAADYIPRNSLSSLARQYWRYGFYRAKTAERHPQTLRLSHLVAPGLTLTAALALISPRVIARPARAAVSVYGLAVAFEAALQLPRHGRDALALPAVFACMHFAYGAGFLAGSARNGPPLRALATLLGAGRS